jgi:hypothetical protein
MNAIELLFFLLAVFLSVSFGKYFFGHIGWWGVLPGGILGFGSVWLFLVVLRAVAPGPAGKRPRG